jgi:radical SAM superfamily enzyme YgiQ (UPF0313 family)
MISYLEKTKDRKINDVVVVYPYTYINPFFAPPPIAAEYLQAGILETGRNARLLDMRFETDIREYLESADLVCVYGYFEDCAIFVKLKYNVIEKVLHHVPENTPIIAGGTGFSEPDQAFSLYPKIDLIIRGNPETPIIDVLESREIAGVKNIAFRSDDGNVVLSERVIHPLSEHIYPRRHLRNPKYHYHAAGIKADTIRAGVGCNYNCRFCYQYGKDLDGKHRRWQGRSARSLFNELKEIDAPIVGWVDDDMTQSMENLGELADLLTTNGVQKLFGGTGRLDHVNNSDLETLTKLEKSGLLALSFGVESLNRKTLQFYGKGQKIEDIEKAMRLMQKTNILLFCSFILGSPGETEQDMMEMLWFGRKWNVDTMVTNRLRVPKDSYLHDQIYDRDGNYRPGMQRIRGQQLAKIKYRIKFGQRTPFRLVLSILKLYRHKGMFIDPLYIVFSAMETAVKYTWVEKTLIVPFLLWLAKKTVTLPGFRYISRTAAIILTPLVKGLNWLFEIVDKYLKISTVLIPNILLFYKYKLYSKQVLRAQTGETAGMKAKKA